MSVPMVGMWDFSCGNHYNKKREVFTGCGEQPHHIGLEACGLRNFLEWGKGTAENSEASYHNQVK